MSEYMNVEQLLQHAAKDVNRKLVFPPLRVERPLRQIAHNLEKLVASATKEQTERSADMPFAVGDRVYALPTHKNNLAANIHHYYGHVSRIWASVAFDGSYWVEVSLQGRGLDLPVDEHLLDRTADNTDGYPFRADEISHLD